MEKRVFPFSAPARWMFWFVCIGGIPFGAFMVYGGSWISGLVGVAGGVLAGLIARSLHGGLELTDDHVRVVRPSKMQTLRFADVSSATWRSARGIAGAASDNWELVLEGTEGGAP